MKGNHSGAWMRLLSSDQRGATAVEYGLILALIFLAVMGGVIALGDSVRGRWNAISNSVSSV